MASLTFLEKYSYSKISILLSLIIFLLLVLWSLSLRFRSYGIDVSVGPRYYRIPCFLHLGRFWSCKKGMLRIRDIVFPRQSPHINRLPNTKWLTMKYTQVTYIDPTDCIYVHRCNNNEGIRDHEFEIKYIWEGLGEEREEENDVIIF